MEPSKKKQLKISKFEFACYIIAGVLALWGIAEIIVGGVALSLPANNPLREANATYRSLFGLDMLYWGIILLVMGATLAVIVLLVYARNTDRDYEKAQRRAARLGRDVANNENQPVVDAKVEEPAPAEESK